MPTSANAMMGRSHSPSTPRERDGRRRNQHNSNSRTPEIDAFGQQLGCDDGRRLRSVVRFVCAPEYPIASTRLLHAARLEHVVSQASRVCAMTVAYQVQQFDEYNNNLTEGGDARYRWGTITPSAQNVTKVHCAPLLSLPASRVSIGSCCGVITAM